MGQVYMAGDTVVIRFKASTRGQPLEVAGAVVSVYRDDELILGSIPLDVIGNRVAFSLGQEYTQKSGDYTAIFTVSLVPNTVRTHYKKFAVVPRGAIISTEMDNILVPVTKKSTEHEVDEAINRSTRHLRRGGNTAEVAAQMSRDLAQKKTKKRVIR